MADGAPAVELLESLGLVGDGDELDVVRDIESSFGVTIPENADWATVGDIYQFLLDARSPEDQPGKCATAMSFYAMRKAVGSRDKKLRPSDRPDAVLDGSPNLQLKALSEKTGLVFPSAAFGVGGYIGLACAAVGLLSLLFGLGMVIAIPLCLLAYALLKMDRGRYPVDTFGELAESVAGLNFDRLVSRGADGRSATIWKTLQTVIASDTGIAHPGRIAIDTRIFG